MLDEIDPASLEPRQLEDIEVTLDSHFKRGCHCNHKLVAEEEEAALAEADDREWELFQELITATKGLCRRLMAIREVHGKIQTADKILSQLKDKRLETPNKDYTIPVRRISEKVNDLLEILESSTIPSDHKLRVKAMELEISLEDMEIVDIILSPAESKDFSKELSKKKRTFKLPKLDIPKFDGQLKNWSRWWTDFKHAVHDNEDLDNRDRLAYLIRSITDPALQDYFRAGAETKDTYPEVLEVLKQWFDQPRELHIIYYRTLADLPPAKHTTESLNQLADKVFASVTGIIQQGQSAIQHVATSLAVSSLPHLLRTEWETKTEAERDVPDVFDLIKYIRKKAVITGKEQKYTPSQRPEQKKGGKQQPSKQRGSVHVANPQPAQQPPAYQAQQSTQPPQRGRGAPQ